MAGIASVHNCKCNGVSNSTQDAVTGGRQVPGIFAKGDLSQKLRCLCRFPSGDRIPKKEPKSPCSVLPLARIMIGRTGHGKARTECHRQETEGIYRLMCIQPELVTGIKTVFGHLRRKNGRQLTRWGNFRFLAGRLRLWSVRSTLRNFCAVLQNTQCRGSWLLSACSAVACQKHQRNEQATQGCENL